MKKLITIFIFLLAFASQAQDIIKSAAGDIEIHPILHGSLVITHQDLTIYVDPYGGAELFKKMKDADLILITDIHGDHLHKATLNALNTSNADFIVPQAVANQMGDIPNKSVTVLNNGESTKYSKINISAIPMYNLPESEQSRHVKGRGNGYILTIGDKKLYISGDTEDIQEMRSLENIDVAFVCMNLPYTMSVEQAASAVNEFKPKMVFPYHFRGKNGYSDVERFQTLVNAKSPDVEVMIRNWYPEK